MSFVYVQLISPLPDVSVVRSIQLLAWSAACGDVSLSSDPTSIHNAFTLVRGSPLTPAPIHTPSFPQLSSSSRGVDTEDMHLSRDSLEVLSMSIAISPHVLPSLESSQDWKHFVIDSLLLIRNRSFTSQIFLSVCVWIPDLLPSLCTDSLGSLPLTNSST